MKAIVLVAALLLPALAGAALANAPSSTGEEAATVDLSQYTPGGPIIYVFCDHHTTLADCQGMSFYQESNGLGKLQHLGLQVTSEKRYDPDAKLLL